MTAKYKGTIEEQWRSYRSNVIASSASMEQIVECRLSFYAGAAALFMLVTNDANRVPELQLELEAFHAKVLEEGPKA